MLWIMFNDESTPKLPCSCSLKPCPSFLLRGIMHLCKGCQPDDEAAEPSSQRGEIELNRARWFGTKGIWTDAVNHNERNDAGDEDEAEGRSDDGRHRHGGTKNKTSFALNG